MSSFPSFLPASTHRQYTRVNNTDFPPSSLGLFLNPWKKSTCEQMEEMESEKLAFLNRNTSTTFDGSQDRDKDVASDSFDEMEAISYSSPTLTTHTTSKWIDEQIALNTSSSSSKNPVDSIEDEPVLTLYQGFKAHHPKLALRRSDSNSSISVQSKIIEMPVLAPSIAAPSTRTSKLPAKARHQAVSINNIANIFSNLLKERESLAREAENTETERIQSEDELKQIEVILTQFSIKKREVLEKINKLIKKEDKLNESIDSLDQRICSIGDHTVGIEKKIRSIRGDSALELIQEEEEDVHEDPFKTYFGHTDTVECVDFEMSEGILISGSADKTLRVWDMATHQCKGVLEGHDGWIRSVQLNGYQIISGSGDHTAKLWDISRLEVTGVPLLDNQDDVDEPLLKTYYGHSAGITCLQFEQGRLLTGSIDKTIRSFDMETGGTLSVLYAMKPLESTQLDTILYPESKSDSPFSDLLSNKDFTGWNEIHESNSDAPALISRNNCGHVGGLHFYQHALAAGYGDGQIRLFDLRTGKCHRQLIEHSMAVTAVNFDDNEIISGSLDKTIKVWDLRMGQTTHSIETLGNITDLSFNNLRIAVASSCKSVLLYSRMDWSCNELVGHSKSSRCVKISNSGGRLVSGGLDHTIRIWRL